MVTLYLAGTSIRLESKIEVGEQIYNKYNKFCKELPEKFMVAHESVESVMKVRKTRNEYFAYLNARYRGEDVIEAATKLEKENERLIEKLSVMKETISFDQNTESESEPELLGIVYLYAMQRIHQPSYSLIQRWGSSISCCS